MERDCSAAGISRHASQLGLSNSASLVHGSLAASPIEMSEFNVGSGFDCPSVLASSSSSVRSLLSRWESIGIPAPPAYSPKSKVPPTVPPRIRKQTETSSVTSPTSDLSSSFSMDAIFDPEGSTAVSRSPVELRDKSSFDCQASSNPEPVSDTYGTLPSRMAFSDLLKDASFCAGPPDSSFFMSDDEEDDESNGNAYCLPDSAPEYLQLNAVSVRISDDAVGNGVSQRDSTLSVTEEGYAHWFRQSEATYITQLGRLKTMVDIIGSEAADNSNDKQLLVDQQCKLEHLKAAIDGMQKLASDLHQHLDELINKWEPSQGPPRFMHIYCTRGQFLRLYPSVWFTVIESILSDFNRLKQSNDPRALRLFESIRELTGKCFAELLHYPLSHLWNFRSKLEKYVDYLEEPEQQKMNGAEEECLNAEIAFDMVKDIMESEDQPATTAALAKLADLFGKSSMLLPLDPKRKLIKHGELTASGKKYLAYLFNDIILLVLLANEKKGEKIESFHEVTDWAVLKRLPEASGITNSHGPTFEFIGWPTRQKYIFTASSENECREWLSTLEDVKDKQTSGKRSKVVFLKAGQERWVPDEQRTQCTICGCKFTATFRRHHCRHCGEIFCSKCTPPSAWVKYESQKQRSRTCTQCFKEFCSLPKEERSLSSSFKDLSVNARSLKVPSRSKSLKSNANRASCADNATVAVEYHIPADPNAETSRLPKRWIIGQLFLADDVLGIAKDNRLAFSVSLRQVCPLFEHSSASEDSLSVQIWQSTSDWAGRAASRTFQTRIVKLLIEIRWSDEQLRKFWANKIEKQRLAFLSVAR